MPPVEPLGSSVAMWICSPSFLSLHWASLPVARIWPTASRTFGDGRHEYALVARTGGASVVDVTDPSLPVYVGLLAAEGGTAQDIKVYADHAFFIGAGDTGMLVFDLQRLRDVEALPVTLTLVTMVSLPRIISSSIHRVDSRFPSVRRVGVTPAAVACT